MSMAERKREFTGWHMLAIMVAFFSVVISVNLTMAYFARSSWTGFVVENRYVASREFNGKVAEHQARTALGWTSELGIAGGALSYRLTDSAGNVVAAKRATASFRRPATAVEDLEIAMTPRADGSFAAPIDLRDGVWIAQIVAEAGLDQPYRYSRRIILREGRIQ